MILCELFYVTLYEKFGYWPSLQCLYICSEERIFFYVLPEKSFKPSLLNQTFICELHVIYFIKVDFKIS